MISVSELNEKIKALLETTFMHVMVEGEIASVTYHSSGHIYFSIKDELSTIKCVMWRSNAKKLKFKLEAGEHIVIDGSLTVYTPRGEYQLIAVNIEPYGKGALAVAFEQLKAKLKAKGYFDESIKKPLPIFPKKIAVVTAKESAACADIIKVATKRWPLIELIIIDTLVQGDLAKNQIAKAIEYADTLNADIILVARGGGSIEDLWAFNEEIVADSIFNAKTPVVSAIGHEVDILISDFVADLRAPTPSAAVEMILPDINDYLFILDDLLNSLNNQIDLIIFNKEQKLTNLKQNFQALSPTAKLNNIYQQFNILKNRYIDTINFKLSKLESELLPLINRFNHQIELILQKKNQDLDILKRQLLLNNPEEKIKDGFAEVIKDGKRINLCKLKSKDKIELVNSKCKIKAIVE